jgi:antirestriction protein ArdC
MAKKSQEQIRQEVCDKMIEGLSKDVPPWRKPWSPAGNTGHPMNFASRRRYTGVNPLILLMASMEHGYDSKFWGTGRSWTKELGGKIIKGEHGTPIVLLRMLPQKNDDGSPKLDDKGQQKMFPWLTYWTVFNIAQIEAPTPAMLLDGRCRAGSWGSIVRAILTPDSTQAREEKTTKLELVEIITKFAAKRSLPKVWPPENLDRITYKQLAQMAHEAIEAKLEKYRATIPDDPPEPDWKPAEALIAACGADIRFGGDRACYNPGGDFIRLPHKGQFDCVSAYYETAFHEHVHWGEGKGRVPKHKDTEYAFDELVAEIGACLLMAELNVPLADQMIEHSQAYVKHWLEGMKNDPKFIFHAATQAGRVADHLLAYVGRENPPYEEEPKRKRVVKKAKKKVAKKKVAKKKVAKKTATKKRSAA